MKLSIKTKGPNNLASWRETMKAAPALVDEMGQLAAEEALDLVAEGFQKEQDPYGSKWANAASGYTGKKCPDGRSMLVGKTTRLRRGWHVIKKSNGKWSIAPSVEYAGAHQDPQPRPLWGGKSLPRRMMIPSKMRGLPTEWRKRLEEAMGDVFQAHFGGSKGSANLGFIRYKVIGLKRRFSLPAILKRAIKEATDG